MIEYSIKAARSTGLFEDVIVSTDDHEIAEISRLAGASVPFIRSSQTSTDTAGLAEVLLEVIDRYESENIKLDTICCLLATAPLMSPATIRKCHELFVSGAFDSAFPVVRFSYPIWRSLKFEGSRIVMNWPENYAKNSQELPPAFHDCGQFYWIRTEAFRRKGTIFTENSTSLEIDEIFAQDIDTEADWEICELKYELLQRKAGGSVR